MPLVKNVGGVIWKWTKVTILTISKAITQLKFVKTLNQKPHAHLGLASKASTKFQVI